MASQYSKYLERAFKNISQKASSGERFDVPEPSCAINGPKTIVFNFSEICLKLNREPRQLLKFLSKEMATAAAIDGTRAIFQGNFSEQTIMRLLTTYCNRYIICPICKRPDTKIKKEERISFLICEACGARSSITHR